VEKELAEVIDGVGHKGGDAEVIGTSLSFAEVEIGKIDAGEEEQRILVVSSKLMLGL
jgi:hypothetical protein